jgi:hypothetical protein
MPPFNDFLVCGISAQRQRVVPNFDEVIATCDPDFSASGLKSPPLIRLGYLAVLPQSEFKDRIGTVAIPRLVRLLTTWPTSFTRVRHHHKQHGAGTDPRIVSCSSANVCGWPV